MLCFFLLLLQPQAAQNEPLISAFCLVTAPHQPASVRWRWWSVNNHWGNEREASYSVLFLLTCPTPTRATLASRCSKMTARKLPRCGAGTPAKSTYCDLSSFGPALFEICWPDIYLGGPYGPVKYEMYWPELVRRSEKCAGPAGQCLCRGLTPCIHS